MSDKLKPIDVFAEEFFEWDGNKKTPYVTLTSAKFFAEEWAKHVQHEAVISAGDSQALREVIGYAIARLEDDEFDQALNMLKSVRGDKVRDQYPNDRSRIAVQQLRDSVNRMAAPIDYADALLRYVEQLERQNLAYHVARTATTEAELAKAREVIADLIQCGKEVVNRWDSPSWKWDDEHTGDKIERLRKALQTAQRIVDAPEQSQEEREQRRQDFMAACRPLMEWLNKNGHPHMKAIVDQCDVELVEGVMSGRDESMLRD